MMRIAALPGGHGACAYYRVHAPLAALVRAGVAEVWNPVLEEMPNGRSRCVVTAKQLEGCDVAVFQRQPEDPIGRLMTLLHDQGTLVVFDIDDDVYTVPADSSAYGAYGRDWRKMGAYIDHNVEVKAGGDAPRVQKVNGVMDNAKKQAARGRANFSGILQNLRQADLVTVSTGRLREVYGSHNDRVTVLRNQLEPRDWEHALANPIERFDNNVWIGWAGSRTHWGDLSLIAKPVIQVLQRNPHARLVIVGFPEAQKLFRSVAHQLIMYNWMSITEYRRVVAAFDVVLAPSVKLDFNDAKSDIRVLEAAACSRPVVASETTYGNTIRESGCGFVARTTQKWIKYLNRLVNDAPLREAMGEAGNKYVLNSRTYDLNVWQWMEAYS